MAQEDEKIRIDAAPVISSRADEVSECSLAWSVVKWHASSSNLSKLR